MSATHNEIRGHLVAVSGAIRALRLDDDAEAEVSEHIDALRRIVKAHEETHRTAR